MKVVICDDEESRRDSWKARLESLLGQPHEVALLTDFERHYAALLSRREQARARRQEGVSAAALPDDDGDWASAFDEADVLLVDYDLFGFDPDNYLTGAIVAYLVRCYSRCRVIASVNEFGPNPFDLTLGSDRTSFADVTIGEAQIDNPALWFGQSTGVFRPWSWPPLLRLVERQSDRAASLESRLDEHVIDAVGLHGLLDFLPRSAVGLLERAGDPGSRTTLAELARGARLGYRRGDEPPSRPALARVASARAAKWLERAVLPLQDVLIDAPHLAQRNPALLDQVVDTDAALAATTRRPADHVECGIRPEAARHRHGPGVWLTRPAFRWPDIAADTELPGVADPWNVPPLERVFCEDLSSFVPAAHARRFVTDLDSSSAARWVADPVAAELPELLEVDYRPVARLAI